MKTDQILEPPVIESMESDPEPSHFRKFLPTRRFALRWLAVAILAACGFAWLLSWWSPVPVREVVVVDASEDSVAAIRAAAGSLEGQALRDIDVDGVAARVMEVPGIESVSLAIQRPWTVAVVVDERHTFAQIEVEGGYEIVDDSGDMIRVSKKKLKRLPVLGGDSGSRATALALLHQMPESLTRRLASVDSRDDGRTELTLRSGTVIDLGSVDSTARKIGIVEALLPLKPKTIDVSVPARPAVSGDLKLPKENRAPQD